VVEGEKGIKADLLKLPLPSNGASASFDSEMSRGRVVSTEVRWVVRVLIREPGGLGRDDAFERGKKSIPALGSLITSWPIFNSGNGR
jgi:hypothetical protein